MICPYRPVIPADSYIVWKSLKRLPGLYCTPVGRIAGGTEGTIKKRTVQIKTARDGS